MSDYDYDNAVFRIATAQEAEPEDYTGEDGLLYCGKCRQPKEAYFAEGRTLFGRDRHPKNVTASGNAGKHWKPPTGSRNTGRKWNG